MEDKKIAVLLTCFNRKAKTIACLHSLHQAILPKGYQFEVFLVDDGSTDDTSEAVNKTYPNVNVIQGSGSLYWAGGMRLAFNSISNINELELLLLLNDDTIVYPDCINDLILTHEYTQKHYEKPGVYVGSTQDPITKEFTYGARKFYNKKAVRVLPSDSPKVADFANANILMISSVVINNLGFFDTTFTHGIADYDYTLNAGKKGYPIVVCPNYQGSCINDHGNNWLSTSSTLKNRVTYLYSPTGLSYREYTYYIKKNFGVIAYVFAVSKLWLKTIFPFIWDVLKK